MNQKNSDDEKLFLLYYVLREIKRLKKEISQYNETKEKLDMELKSMKYRTK